ncbi:hypothetical protein [Pseudomonas phoenicis]|uniref:hypothetical protein n=1 Tax=unclassified Pseudomonas TaxID=196821 RepID=UPI0039A3345A
MHLTTDVHSPSLADTKPFASPMFFVVSPVKLVLMTILAGPVYWSYWYYRNWRNCRDSTGERIWPIARTLLGGLMLYCLLARVDQQLRLSGRPATISPIWTTCGLVAILAAQVWIVLMSTVVPVLIVGAALSLIPMYWLVVGMQRAINRACGDDQGLSNSRLTVWNGLWIVVSLLPHIAPWVIA